VTVGYNFSDGRLELIEQPDAEFLWFLPHRWNSPGCSYRAAWAHLRFPICLKAISLPKVRFKGGGSPRLQSSRIEAELDQEPVWQVLRPAASEWFSRDETVAGNWRFGSTMPDRG
jgi:hypothetical protein